MPVTKFRLYYFFRCFLVIGYFSAQTPTFSFQKLGSEEGLNNANIFNIEQQQNGLIYFTTQNGIYYYDGYNFKVLLIDSLKSNALLNTKIKSKEALYLSIRGEGIVDYNTKTKQFGFLKNLHFNNNADNLIINDNFAFLLSAEIKLTILDLESGKMTDDQLNSKEKLNRAFCIYETNDGKILVGRSDGLYDVTDGYQKKIPVVKNEPIHAITQKPNGDLVLGTSGSILIVSNNKIIQEITPVYKTKSFTFQLGGEKSIDKLVADGFGRVWFTSYPDDHLYLYQNGNTYDLFDILGLPSALINCIYKDKKENIWVGTFNEGVYYIQNPFFTSVNFIYNNSNLNVGQVYLKDNLLVAATGNGLYGLNLTNNQEKVLSKPDEIPDPVNGITEWEGVLYYSKSSPFNLSPALFFDSKNSYKLKPVVARQFYPINNKQSVLADHQADILLCTLDGSKVLDTLISFPDYRISVNAFFKQSDSLFIATNNGLYLYLFHTKKYRHLVGPELNFHINDLALINNKLYAAHEAGITDVSSGNLVRQIGDFYLNSVKKIKQFNGKIWLATLDGVYICDSQFTPLKIFNKSNGLPSNSVNDIAFNDGTVTIATARGIATTDLDHINGYDSKLEPISINYITANGEKVNADNNALTLKAEQEDVTIYFYSPFFNKPNKQFFRYKLDDGDWKMINELSLSLQLKGGFHRMEISASADNLVWSDSTVLKIAKDEKLSERQETYLFITLGGLLLIVGISVVWIRRVKLKARKRLQEEQHVNLLKHQAMNSLLSPHFIFNSLTSIQNYINTNNSLKASEYLAKFSRLIRMIIEKASQSDITLYDELARLTYYLELEKERFKNKFDYVIHIDETVNTHEIKIPNMIIQPHVENCIIHGILPKQEHGTLTISFKRHETGKFFIIIEDDGIGLIKAAEHVKTGHKSLGTSTIKNILEINSKLTGKKQKVTMVDKSTLDPSSNGTLITIELDQ